MSINYGSFPACPTPTAARLLVVPRNACSDQHKKHRRSATAPLTNFRIEDTTNEWNTIITTYLTKNRVHVLELHVLFVGLSPIGGHGVGLLTYDVQTKVVVCKLNSRSAEDQSQSNCRPFVSHK